MTDQPLLGGGDEQDEGDDRATDGVDDRVLDHLGRNSATASALRTVTMAFPRRTTGGFN
jgi:hypothetical protein